MFENRLWKERIAFLITLANKCKQIGFYTNAKKIEREKL